MIEVIFAAHGLAAPGMQDSVEMVMGAQPHLHILSLTHDEGIEAFREGLTQLIHRLQKDTRRDILILTDMPAGTPYNVSVQLSLANPAISVVAGANFPMVLTALDQADMPLEELTRHVIEIGKEAIHRFMESTSAQEDF